MKTLIITIILASATTAVGQTVSELKNDIELLTGKSSPAHDIIAASVLVHSKKKNINPKVVLAILMTESTFNQDAVSATGDYGIGQINPKVWSQEFVRLKKKPLNEARLKSCVDYAISRTVEILSIVKKEEDPFWIGRYHSKTPSLKKLYYGRVQTHLEKINSPRFNSNLQLTLAVNP